MEIFTNMVTQTVAEILTILVGAVITAVGIKVNSLVSTLKQKDQLGIVDTITDRAAEYAENQLKGQPGKDKLNFAVDKALEMLAERKIKLSKEEVIAGIENGVNKLKERGVEHKAKTKEN